MTADDLKLLFAEYGKVEGVTLPMDFDKGRIQGFAFVEMST